MINWQMRERELPSNYSAIGEIFESEVKVFRSRVERKVSHTHLMIFTSIHQMPFPRLKLFPSSASSSSMEKEEERSSSLAAKL
jgi:hypothetical protein